MPQCWLGGDGTAKSLYLGTKLIKHDLTFSPQPSPAISWIIRGLILWPHKRKQDGQMWNISQKPGRPGDYKAQSSALLPRNQLGQITRLFLSTCKITRSRVTGNIHLSRKIMSSQSNFLQWKGNRSCGQQRNSSVMHLDLIKLSDTLSPDIPTGIIV